ncbi:uncharacterized protein LOC131438570 [Malaya genurostris]|uniref:uncharacterized protein LOC131438570 n=1 Tax=Malaya genurostris TaxID=325434 RepID=UPI0026F3E0C1|nr:uncharacterized protein LOC131438570 [Malaya genurostris]
MRLTRSMINQATAYVSILLIYCVLFSTALSCDSCGKECTSACGTRHFRTCCFNYLRKRSPLPPLATQPPPPSPLSSLSPHKFNLEMWLEKARLEQAGHRGHHRPLDNLQELFIQRMLPGRVTDAEIDYETAKDDMIARRSVANAKQNSFVDSSHSNRVDDNGHPLLDGDPDGQESEQRTSEESEPAAARLQLLYDS